MSDWGGEIMFLAFLCLAIGTPLFFITRCEMHANELAADIYLSTGKDCRVFKGKVHCKGEE